MKPAKIRTGQQFDDAFSIWRSKMPYHQCTVSKIQLKTQETVTEYHICLLVVCATGADLFLKM